MFHDGFGIGWRSTSPRFAPAKPALKGWYQSGLFLQPADHLSARGGGRRGFALSVRNRTATAAAPWCFCGMSPTAFHLQVQKELALLRSLGRLRRVASLSMFAVRSLGQRVSPIMPPIMPVIEQSDEPPAPGQRRRGAISRTRLATGAQG